LEVKKTCGFFLNYGISEKAEIIKKLNGKIFSQKIPTVALKL